MPRGEARSASGSTVVWSRPESCGRCRVACMLRSDGFASIWRKRAGRCSLGRSSWPGRRSAFTVSGQAIALPSLSTKRSGPNVRFYNDRPESAFVRSRDSRATSWRIEDIPQPGSQVTWLQGCDRPACRLQSFHGPRRPNAINHPTKNRPEVSVDHLIVQRFQCRDDRVDLDARRKRLAAPADEHQRVGQP